MEEPIASLRIEPMRPEGWPEVRAIFEDGIASGDATFETAAPEWPEWDAAHRPDCRLVARLGDRVVAWAALSPVSERCAYEGVAEMSIYVAADARGRGIGRQLLNALVQASEAAGVWTLQAGIFPENTASLRLAEGAGFGLVGVRQRLGQGSDGRWRDVSLLERRSSVVGTN